MAKPIKEPPVNKPAKAAGRPREFDVDQALDVAMRLFWEKGYDATSMQDVVDALKINRASLYGVFGDKQVLLTKALGRYLELHGAPLAGPLVDEGDPKKAIAKMLQRVATQLADSSHPRGCLMAANASVANAPAITRQIGEAYSSWENQIYQVLRRAQAEGSLARDRDPRALSRFFLSVIQGMSFTAKLNPDPSALRDIAATAMEAWS